MDGKRVAQGRDFTSVGQLRGTRRRPAPDGEAAAALAARLQGAASAVSSVERKPYRRSPYAPFRTTTLQQEASRKLGFTAKYTMSVAQRLYENGYITYMRTDSITLSQTAIDAARNQARELYGAEYVPDAPRTYASKVKNAQEAHEAIRPAGDRFRTPQEASGRAQGRRAAAVRPDLEAHGRLPDEGRHRRVGVGQGRRDLQRQRAGRVRRVRQDHPLLRVPQGLRGVQRRPGGRPGRPGAPPAGAGRGATR